MQTSISVAVIGARGYSGLELCRLLMNHPFVHLKFISSTQKFELSDELPQLVTKKSLQPHPTWKSEEDILRDPPQLVFLATPAETSLELAAKFMKAGVSVIDLSGAFRLKNSDYKTWYKFEHDQPELLQKAQYGLVPFSGPALGGAPFLIANPGCYATAILMALIPLLKDDLIDRERIVIDAKSGTTGAGRKASENLLFSEVAESVSSYRVGKHQHLPEIQESIQSFCDLKISPQISTHLLPVRRGIMASLYLQTKASREEILSCFEKYYSDYPLVRLFSDVEKGSRLELVAKTPMTHISFEVVGTHLYVFSCLDNLLKGGREPGHRKSQSQLRFLLRYGIKLMTPGPGLHRTVLPKGFLASGVNCGVRRYRPDLGLIMSEVDCVVAGVFTQNQCKAAPVLYSQRLLPSDKIRGLITNSGQANAATGAEGIENNRLMVDALAKNMNVATDQILVASTGVIGSQLAIDKILPAMPELVERASSVAESFALAILTTDLVPKTVTTLVSLSKGEVRITGICKGSGMIHPNMATMLGYMLTDAKLTMAQADRWLRDTTDVSFNMISVDGDSSTNDCNFLLANGESGITVESAEDQAKFTQALTQVSQFLAQSIAADGEGASKLIEVQIVGAPELQMARRAARGVTVSPLIKTAVHGEDPNWGRILARLGAEQVPSHCLEQMSLRLQGHLIFDQGAPLAFSRDLLKSALRDPKVQIQIDLKSGNETATAWGCDLSRKYVEINTEYS